MVVYTFECDDELWYEWADKVPRSENLDDRLVTLIEQDLRESP